MDHDDVLCRRVEEENERIAREFVDGWSQKDVDKILAHVADDVVYMVHEKGRTLQGKEEVRNVLTNFMKLWDKIEFNILKLQVMGPLVIHERTEDYAGKGDQPDWHFWVAALLVIRDGKIEIWRDYNVPGKKQDLGGSTASQLASML